LTESCRHLLLITCDQSLRLAGSKISAKALPCRLLSSRVRLLLTLTVRVTKRSGKRLLQLHARLTFNRVLSKNVGFRLQLWLMSFLIFGRGFRFFDGLERLCQIGLLVYSKSTLKCSILSWLVDLKGRRRCALLYGSFLARVIIYRLETERGLCIQLGLLAWLIR